MRASYKKHVENNPDFKANERERSRRHYEANKESRTEQIDAYRATARGKETRRRSEARMKVKYPARYAARQAVKIALAKGELVKRPCEKCGDVVSQAHHSDYSKPLDVVWLCVKHHKEADKMKE